MMRKILKVVVCKRPVAVGGVGSAVLLDPSAAVIAAVKRRQQAILCKILVKLQR
jgi:hypothetical protein